MTHIVECVPNFSEGRRRDVVDELIRAVTGVAGVTFLDSEMDADHNRSVITFAGEPEPVIEAAVRVVARAAELIDLTRHSGQHPRMGAADVVPFVPVEGVSLDDCAGFARSAGARIGAELGIPVFLYEAAASRPDRTSLADVRRGQFEGLRDAIGADPARTPDFGPHRIHPTAGATAVGARRFLVAFNANLATGDVRVAKAVAAAIREQNGGLKNVRALGFAIENGRRAQVSMNLVNTEATPIHRVLALIRAEAARHGTMISGCEVVGLIPQAAMLDAAEHALQLEGFRRDQVLELRLAHPPLTGATALDAFMDSVSDANPTPGGGTVAAVAGAIASCLPVMVANLTLGRKKFATAEPELRSVKDRATTLRSELLGLARLDSEAFDAVLKARRLPATTVAEVTARDQAVALAELEATRIPLTTAKLCVEVAELAARAARSGNPNAVTDAGVAGRMAAAAAEGALLNVKINLKSLGAGADKDDIEKALPRLEQALVTATRSCSEAVDAVLNA